MQNYKPKLKTLLAVGLIILIFAVSFFIFRSSNDGTATSAELDSFARCLADKGFVMYGAYWCPHCQNEKAAFGDSFKKVNYVECTKEPNRCVAADIKGYPTWITDDGRRFEGEQGIDGLAEVSGCSLNNSVIPASAGGQIRPNGEEAGIQKSESFILNP